MVTSSEKIEFMDSKFITVHAGNVRYIIRCNGVDDEGNGRFELVEQFKTEKEFNGYLDAMRQQYQVSLDKFVADLHNKDNDL